MENVLLELDRQGSLLVKRTQVLAFWYSPKSQEPGDLGPKARLAENMAQTEARLLSCKSKRSHHGSVFVIVGRALTFW